VHEEEEEEGERGEEEEEEEEEVEQRARVHIVLPVVVHLHVLQSSFQDCPLFLTVPSLSLQVGGAAGEQNRRVHTLLPLLVHLQVLQSSFQASPLPLTFPLLSSHPPSLLPGCPVAPGKLIPALGLGLGQPVSVQVKLPEKHEHLLQPSEWG